MKMIDDHIDALIRTDEKGNRICFPYGALTRGRTIPSEHAESELRQFLRKRMTVEAVVVFLFVAVIVLFCHKYAAKIFLVFAILTLLLLAYYRRRINRILKGSHASDVRQTVDELVVRGMPACVLWFGVIVFGLHLLLRLDLVFREPAWGSIGLFLSSGAVWLVFLILLIKKKKSKGADSPATRSV